MAGGGCFSIALFCIKAILSIVEFRALQAICKQYWRCAAGSLDGPLAGVRDVFDDWGGDL